MTRRGPKPTPRNLRIVKGSDRPSRMNDEEPVVPVSIPDPPDTLSQDEQNVFMEYARKLAKMRVMTEADVGALVIFSRCWIEAQDAHEKVRRLGAIVQAPKSKSLMHNPYWTVRNKAEEKALKILTEFGMTPSSRTRVKIT